MLIGHFCPRHVRLLVSLWDLRPSRLRGGGGDEVNRLY